MKTLLANSNFILFLATLLWGISGIADKNAITRAHPYTVQWLYALPYIVSIPLWYWLSVKAGAGAHPTIAAIGWSFAASVLTLLGMLCLFFAMRDKPASIAMAITSAYPLVTLLIAVLLKQESLSMPKIVGLLLIASGVFVLTLYGEG